MFGLQINLLPCIRPTSITWSLNKTKKLSLNKIFAYTQALLSHPVEYHLEIP